MSGVKESISFDSGARKCHKYHLHPHRQPSHRLSNISKWQHLLSSSHCTASTPYRAVHAFCSKWTFVCLCINISLCPPHHSQPLQDSTLRPPSAWSFETISSIVHPSPFPRFEGRISGLMTWNFREQIHWTTKDHCITSENSVRVSWYLGTFDEGCQWCP